ncbi:unnamed protein product [Ectocarpus fasciculatus]
MFGVCWRAHRKNVYQHGTHPCFCRTVGLDLLSRTFSDVNAMIVVYSTNDGKKLLSLIEAQLGVVNKSGRDAPPQAGPTTMGEHIEIWARSPTAYVSKLARISRV